jgi:hypothetical protein
VASGLNGMSSLPPDTNKTPMKNNPLITSFLAWNCEVDKMYILDDVLEWLEDHNMLNEEGGKFHTAFWKEFIKGKL